MTKLWRLDTSSQTLVIAVEQQKMAKVVYWGAVLDKKEDLSTLVDVDVTDINGGTLDQLPDISLLPSEDDSFPGQPGIALCDKYGSILQTNFRFSSVEKKDDVLFFHYKDERLSIHYSAVIHADKNTDMFILQANLRSQSPVQVLWLAAPVLPASAFADKLIDVAGRWCGEFQLQEKAWEMGVHLRESRLGRTGHEHFPGALIPESGATENQGVVYGFHYGWSGGHTMIAEQLSDGRRQVQFGHCRNSQLKPVTYYETAKLYVCCSDKGFNGVSSAFHRQAKQLVQYPNPQNPRPVHYNCWEAVYFDHSMEELIHIARLAANLGAERFVLDDGWFVGRNDDTSSLGDWQVDTKKYPQGLTPLIDAIHNEGMEFGLWFEPEMVNSDSELFSAKPHWALGQLDQVLGRQQRVLNMALAEVREYLFDAISTLLSIYDIRYIKWDHNRVLPYADAEQAAGTYQLIDRLRESFPHVEIESCASGGARIDFGILARTHRVWLSDSNDAIERLRMQHNASLFLPAHIVGSHVGPRVCHTSGRELPMSFRAWVAAQRHMGFEMDPRELTPDEFTTLKEVTRWWKDNRSWMFQGQQYRLNTHDPAVIAEQTVSETGEQFVAFVGQCEPSKQVLPKPLLLSGLDPKARYQVTLRNKDDISKNSRGMPLIKQGNVIASGQVLMSKGIQLPLRFPAQMAVLEGKKCA